MVSSVSLPPALQQLTQVPNAQTQKPAAPATAPVATDSDGDNDGSGGSVSITPPVNIKA